MICLDTDVASAVMRRGGGPAALGRRLGVVPADEQWTTSVTVAELLYGARKRGLRDLHERIERFLASEVQVAPFDEGAARVFAGIRVDLERAGRPLDRSDLEIASICVARDMTLVTGNVRHFERVPELRVENWLE